MPNWCTSNYVLEGPKEDLMRFSDTVNACLSKPDVKPNGFGKLWLGNIYVAFGGDAENVLTADGLRGCIETDPEAIPCLCGPSSEEEPVSPALEEDGKTRLRFSVTTAWGPSAWLDDMLEEQFPRIRFGWKATDEFGNFHYVRNMSLMGIEPYEVESCKNGECLTETFGYGEEEAMADYLKKETGMPFNREEIVNQTDDFYVKLYEFNQKHEELEDEEYIYVRVWKED